MALVNNCRNYWVTTKLAIGLATKKYTLLWTYLITYNPYVVLCSCIMTNMIPSFITAEEIYFVTSAISLVCYCICGQFTIPACQRWRLTFARECTVFCIVVYEYTCGKIRPGKVVNNLRSLNGAVQRVHILSGVSLTSSLSLSLSLPPLFLPVCPSLPSLWVSISLPPLLIVALMSL